MDSNVHGRTLTLTDAEALLLTEVLCNDVQTLRAEIYKTENYDWRQALKQREVLRAMLDRLASPVT